MPFVIASTAARIRLLIMTEMQIPSDQRRSLLLKPQVVELDHSGVPQPGPNQVLIEVAAVGICGSDVHYYQHGRIADFVVNEPLVLGHEASGVIRAVGSVVSDRQLGQRVAPIGIEEMQYGHSRVEAACGPFIRLAALTIRKRIQATIRKFNRTVRKLP